MLRIVGRARLPRGGGRAAVRSPEDAPAAAEEGGGGEVAVPAPPLLLGRRRCRRAAPHGGIHYRGGASRLAESLRVDAAPNSRSRLKINKNGGIN